MNESTEVLSSQAISPKPSIVILAAVMSFIQAGMGFLVFLGLLGIFVLGYVASVAGYIQKTISNYSLPEGAESMDIMGLINILLVLFMFLALVHGVSLLIFGFGLLKGKKWAWYLQVIAGVLSLPGVLFWPLGTLTTIPGLVVLFYFFTQPIRSYYKV